jgi:hypothetical protein
MKISRYNCLHEFLSYKKRISKVPKRTNSIFKNRKRYHEPFGENNSKNISSGFNQQGSSKKSS